MTKATDFFWGVYVVGKREFFMNLKSIRMIILMIIFTLFVLFTAYVGSMFMGFIADAPDMGSNVERGPVIIALFVVQFIGFIGPIIAIALAFDVIVKEKIQNSLSLLMCRPVSKRSVALGKFLGLTGALALPVFLVNLLTIVIVSAISEKSIGILQTLGFLVLTMVFLATYIALAQLISSVVKTTTTGILVGIVVWFVFWLFLPIITMIVRSDTIGLVNPATSYSICMTDLLGIPIEQILIPLWGYYLIMVTWLVVMVLLAVEVFQRKEE